MTSKACCSKIQAILKRNVWLAALWFAVLFFALPVYAALALQQARNAYLGNMDFVVDEAARQARALANMGDSLIEVFGQQSMVLVWILMLMAICSALVFGGYMHKQRQVDFYHSQPQRRHELLLQHMAAGLLAVFLPYVANLLLTIVVALAMGAGAAFPWGAFLGGLAVHTLYFTAIFATAMFAVVLTGNGAVAMITGVFLLAVLPSLLGLGMALADTFYPVFYGSLYDWPLIFRWLSPAAAYFCVPINGLPNGIIPIIVYDALLLVATVKLYDKRPSESAGHAIAFKLAKPLLKYAMALLAATIFAYVFHNIGNYSDNYSWWYFGAICGAFLATQICEIVYAFDFRAIRRNLRGLCAFLVIYLALSTCAINDVTGFNTAVPRAEQVASVQMYLPGINNYTTDNWGARYYGGSGQEQQNLERGERDWLAMGPVTSPEGIAAAVRIAERFASEYANQSRNFEVSEAQMAQWQAQGKQYLLDYVNDDYNTELNGYINLNYVSCRVVYTLKNGTQMARSYYSGIPLQYMLDDVAVIYGEADHRAAQLSELSYAAENYLPEYLCIAELYSGAAPLPQLSPEQRGRMISALRADLLDLSIEEQQQNMPVGYLRLRMYGAPVDYDEMSVEKGSRPYLMQTWPIYASFSRTLAFFAEQGYGTELWQPQLTSIVSVSMIDNYIDREMEKYGSYSGMPAASVEYYGAFATSTTVSQTMTSETGEPITDPEQIAALMAASYPSEVTEYNRLIDINSRNELEVCYIGADGQRYYARRVFPY